MTRNLAFARPIKENSTAFGTILSVTARYATVRLDSGTKVGQARLSSQVSDPAIGDRASLIWDRTEWVCISTIGASYIEQAPRFVTTIVETTQPIAHQHTEADILDIDKYSVSEVDTLFAAHSAVADAHHSPITIGTNTASALFLDGQELSLGDVFLLNTTDTFVGTLTVTGNIAVTGTVDGVDVSTHAANVDAHHYRASVGSTNHGAALSVDSNQVFSLADKFLLNTTDEMVGNLTVTGNILVTGTVDGTDISVHVATPNAHHNLVTLGTNTASALSLNNQVLSLADKFLQNTGDRVTGDLEFSANARSTVWTDGAAGWRITTGGVADMRRIFADELHVKSFIADLEQALAGGQIISKSVTLLAENFIVPTNVSPITTIVVEDLPGYPGIPAFAAGDMLRLQVVSRADGISVYYVYGTVSGVPVFLDSTQTWTFTKVSGLADGVVHAGAIVLDLGVSGDGYWETTALGPTAPYAQVATWDTTPSNLTVHTRIGQLSGVTSVDEYGFWAGNATQYIKATAAGLELTGVVNIVNLSDISTSQLTNDANWTTDATANIAVANAATAQNQANTATTNAATAQSKADTAFNNATTAQTAANAAQSTANTAVTNAATAQTAANTANSLLSDIASDNKFTPEEKQRVKGEWDAIVAEASANDTQAITFGIVAEKTTYNNAYLALSTYITPLLTSLTTTSDIVGNTFRSTFKTYYDARTSLLNAFSEKARVLAVSAQNSASSAQATANAAALTANWPNISLIPSTLGTPTGTGLFLSSENMGFYDSGTWKTYMDNTGKFYLSGPLGHGLGWTGTELGIRGNIFVEQTLGAGGGAGNVENGGSIAVSDYGMLSIGEHGVINLAANSTIMAATGSEIEFGQPGGEGYLHYYMDNGVAKLVIEGEITVRGGPGQLAAEYKPLDVEFYPGLDIDPTGVNKVKIGYEILGGNYYLCNLTTEDGSFYYVRLNEFVYTDNPNDLITSMLESEEMYIYTLKNGAVETAAINDGYIRYGIDDADPTPIAESPLGLSISAFMRNASTYQYTSNHILLAKVTANPDFNSIKSLKVGGNFSSSIIGPGYIDTDYLSSIAADLGQITGGSLELTATGSLHKVWLNVGNDDTKIAVGGLDRLNAPFRVWQDGKFRVGSATKYLDWNGTEFTVKGNIQADSGTFNGVVNATSGSFGSAQNQVLVNSNGLNVNTGSIAWSNGAIQSSGIYVSQSSPNSLLAELRIGRPSSEAQGFLDIDMAKPSDGSRAWNYGIHVSDRGNNSTAASSLFHGQSSVPWADAIDRIYDAHTLNNSYSDGFYADMSAGWWNSVFPFDSLGAAFKGKTNGGQSVAIFNQNGSANPSAPVVVASSDQQNRSIFQAEMAYKNQVAFRVDNNGQVPVTALDAGDGHVTYASCIMFVHHSGTFNDLVNSGAIVNPASNHAVVYYRDSQLRYLVRQGGNLLEATL